MNVKPLKDNVIIERQEKEQVSSGGIVLPNGDREAVDKAVVLAIGPEVSDINEGDVVLVNWNKAAKIDDKVYKVSFEDVIGIFE